MRLLLIPIVWVVAMVMFSLFGAMASASVTSERRTTQIFYGGVGIITGLCVLWFIAWL